MTILQAYLQSPKTRRALSKRPGEKGFSLIELVVVVAILAILAAVALPNFLGVSKDGQIAAAKNTLATVLKECSVKETRTGNATFGTSGLTGSDAAIQAATANLNGYTLSHSGDPAAAAIPATAINLAAGGVGNAESCYTITAVPTSTGTLPAFTASFDPATGQTTKSCHGRTNATYLEGCYTTGTTNTVANASTLGSW